MKALSQNGLSIHESSRLLVKGNVLTVRVCPDDFRNGDHYITGFQERTQTGGVMISVKIPDLIAITYDKGCFRQLFVS